MSYRWKNAEVGTCYYPEHWDKTLWEEDLKRMLAHGIQTVRIAEFAWNKIENKEGEYSFEFFDEFLTLADRVGMKVIMGTPTATPPAWMSEKYPEILNCRMDGVPLHHGARRHYNYNSPVYRSFCRAIVEQIASHYSHYDCIVGWQIDNELNCETAEFYSYSDTLAFRRYLKEKFVTLDALNEALGTTFWNQTYTSWEEIFVPRTTINNTVNPHFMLEYKRFVSHSVLSFAQMQAEIIRKYKGEKVFVTTNGMFGNMDNHTLAKDILDVYCYDSYPNFSYMADNRTDDLKDRQWVQYLAGVRSVCPHFGIMEQQSGANGWTSGMQAPSPEPGRIALWSMQSVANGADYISYFRWRTSPFGTEIYWHGILDYDNRDNRKLEEVTRVSERLKKMPNLCQSDYEANFAVMRDYDNIFDSDLDVWHAKLERESMQGIFVASQKLHSPYDFLFIDDESEAEQLKKYKVLFYPHPAIMTEKRAKLLKEYVAGGGTLVLGCRVGYKDIYGKCPVGRVCPGLLTDLTGAEVKEFTFVNPDSIKADFLEEKIEVNFFRDVVSPTSAKVLARYDGGYYKGEAALTENAFGMGKTYYLGSTFTANTALAVMKYLQLDEPFESLVALPEWVEAEKRGDYLFLLNYSAEDTDVMLYRMGEDVDTGEKVKGRVNLDPYGTKIYRLK